MPIRPLATKPLGITLAEPVASDAHARVGGLSDRATIADRLTQIEIQQQLILNQQQQILAILNFTRARYQEPTYGGPYPGAAK